jgi:DNA-binding transcriptional LysR family regulator
MIDKLEFFLALAREQHFGKAAEAIGVTQPTLSAGIKQLEEQLGVMLVQRGARYHGLTPEGERVLDWARRIVGDARAMREDMRQRKRSIAGHITLAVVPTALAAAPELVARFHASHPDATVDIHSRTSQQVLSDLDDLKADCGITYLDNEPVGRVKTQALYEESYALVTRKGGPFSGMTSLGWRDVSGLPLALLTPAMQNRRIIDRALLNVGVMPKPGLQSDSIVALVASVAAGHWCSIVPMRLARLIEATLDVIPLREPDVTQTIGLVAPKREPMLPLVGALMVEARRLYVTSHPMGPQGRDQYG